MRPEVSHCYLRCGRGLHRFLPCRVRGRGGCREPLPDRAQVFNEILCPFRHQDRVWRSTSFGRGKDKGLQGAVDGQYPCPGRGVAVAGSTAYRRRPRGRRWSRKDHCWETGFKKMGIDFIPSAANYYLLKVEARGRESGRRPRAEGHSGEGYTGFVGLEPDVHPCGRQVARGKQAIPEGDGGHMRGLVLAVEKELISLATCRGTWASKSTL